MFRIILILALFASHLAYAGTFEVRTGYGYFKDKEGHIVAKYDFPKGKHPIKEGYTTIEVSSKEALDTVKIYEPPKTEEEKREKKIKKEMNKLLREQAIQSLKDKGEIE